MLINIRGTNGSGKTFLTRQLIGETAEPVKLVSYPAPTKTKPNQSKFVDGWKSPTGEFVAVGSYKQGCGGMDTIPSFEIQRRAVTAALELEPYHVVCEGVLCSTVAGSWLEFFKNIQDNLVDDVLIAYLDTPLDLCLERITARQIAAKGEAREIDTKLVADKVKSIWATKPKFEAAGIRTAVLDFRNPWDSLMEAMNDAA